MSSTVSANASGEGLDSLGGERVSLLTGPRGRFFAALVWSLRRSHLLWRFNFTITGSFRTRVVRIPLVFGMGLDHTPMKELWLLKALGRVLARRAGAVIDVGMNVGQTLLKVKLLDADREYVGFEPNPRAFHYATLFAEQNRFRHCTLVPMAVASHDGIATLLSNSGAVTDVSASIVEGFRPNYPYNRREIVPVGRGDELVERLTIHKVAVVKVDVEGGELDVLEGFPQLLARDRPYVFCEVLPSTDPATETGSFRLARQTRLATFLARNGYEIVRLLSDGRIERLSSFGVHSKMALSNYVFVPKADISEFAREFEVAAN